MGAVAEESQPLSQDCRPTCQHLFDSKTRFPTDDVSPEYSVNYSLTLHFQFHSGGMAPIFCGRDSFPLWRSAAPNQGGADPYHGKKPDLVLENGFEVLCLVQILVDQITNVFAHVLVSELRCSHAEKTLISGAVHVKPDVSVLVFHPCLAHTNTRIRSKSVNLPCDHIKKLTDEQTGKAICRFVRTHVFVAPNQGGRKDSKVMTRVPSRVKTATIDYAHVLNGADPYTEVTQADVLRKSLYQHMLEVWDDLPSPVRNTLKKEELEQAVEDVPDLEDVDFASIDFEQLETEAQS